MQDSFLEMKNISKIFPGMKALDNVNLSIAQGEICAVCGENGAGKSTLINVLSGAIPFGSYTGEFKLEGKLCRFRNIRESESSGIVVIQQQLVLIPEFSVAENVLLGSAKTPLRAISWNSVYKTALAQLDRVGFQGRLSDAVSGLSPADQQLVSIAKALTKRARLLILDEPTASLNTLQRDRLFDLLNSLKKEGIAVILVSHNVRDVAKAADKIIVLRDGQVTSTFEKNAARAGSSGNEADSGYDEESIIRTMVGRRLAERFPKRKCTPGDILVEIRDWTVYDSSASEHKVCDGVNIFVREGEVVGLAGLIDSGCSEFARSVFGRSYGENISGSIFMRGRQIQANSVRNAIDHHFAYISETQQGRNLFANDTISTNITIAKLKGISPLFVVRKEKERVAAEKYRRELGIRCLSVEQNVDALSAGSRQKVLLGKWLFTNPDFLIMDEPTGGVDMTSKYEFYSTVNGLVEQGKGVLLITAEVSELLGMCDRIYVMSAGRIVGELSKEEATQDTIMDCILQAERNSGEAV